MEKVYIHTLGCDKNIVDSEKIGGMLNDANYVLSKKPEDSDYVIINTCSFIDSAKQESIDTILKYVEFRKNNSNINYLLIVAGCLPVLYKENLKKKIPEVDLWIEPSNYLNIVDILHGRNFNEKKEKGYLGTDTSRVSLNNKHYRFLKISDGCMKNCSYCIIPEIRGSLNSRILSDIKSELDRLKTDNDLKELIIVSQNSMMYGSDNKTDTNIIDLLDLLGSYNFFWKRLLYLDITKINKKFLKAMKRNNILPYFDIPLQHIDVNVLQDMNRNYNIDTVLKKIDLINKYFENPVLRTTFIVGFPTETKKRFKKLKKFVKRNIFDKVGVFEYSHQKLSLAYKKYEDKVLNEEKIERFNILNRIIEKNNIHNLKKYVGKKMKVLMDKPKIGRIWADAPEVDNVVYINKSQQSGDIVNVKITGSLLYNLEGEVIEDD